MTAPQDHRFELRGELGRGAMGTVYRAYDQQLQREVALKLVHREAGLERLRREAQAAAGLDHPGLVKVHDCVELSRGPAIVSELVEGAHPLSDLLLPETPLSERLALVLSVAQAMAHAHARGVVHRDLKPENVLLDRRRVARPASGQRSPLRWCASA